MKPTRSLPCSLLGGVLLAGTLTLGATVPIGAQATPTGETVGTLRLVVWNIRHGRGTDDEVDLQRIAEVIRTLDADVVALQEVDDRTERTGGVDQVAVLADALRYEGFHGPHRPYQGGFYGNALLTRLPVLSQRMHEIPPASGSALAVHEVVVALPPADGDRSVRGLPVSVFSVHLAGSPDERMAQARTLDAVARVSPWRPTMLAGDFNGRPDDDVVRWLAERWTIAEKSGDPRTYPAGEPDREIDFVAWRVDPRLIDVTPSVIEHRVVAESVASDHRPLLTVFDFHR